MGLRLVFKFCMKIESIHCLRFCLPFFGSHLSIFLLPKVTSYSLILTIHHLYISLSIGLPWIYFYIFRTGKMILGPQEKPIRMQLFLGLFLLFSKYSKYLSSNVSRVKLIPNEMSFMHNFTAYFWLLGEFLVKYEIAFFTRGNCIKGYIATESIDAIVTSFILQFKISNFSFTCYDWTIVNLV